MNEKINKPSSPYEISPMNDISNFKVNVLDVLMQNNDEQLKQSEEYFNNLLKNNPCLLFNILIVCSSQNDPTQICSITLLGRAIALMSDSFPSIGDEEFHLNFQASLISLIQNVTLSPYLLSNVSYLISRVAKIYTSHWPTLFESLMKVVLMNNPYCSAAALDCLSKCVNNESILTNQYGSLIMKVVQSIILDQEINVNFLFLSTIRLAFSLYRKNPNDESLTFLSKPICSAIAHTPPELIDNYMIELSNLADDHIEFFEPTYTQLIPLLASLISNPLVPERALNSSISLMTQIFSNKKCKSKLAQQALQFYDLLLQVICRNLTEIDPIEGDDESNTISIAKDGLTMLSEFYGGYNEFVIHAISFFETPINDIPVIISHFIAFQCVVEEIIEYINYPDTIKEIIQVYGQGFQCPDVNCRYRAIVSFNQIMKAFMNETTEFFAEVVILMIFSSLNRETVPVVITFLLKSLKTYLFVFEDYEDLIPVIMEFLFERFNTFTFQQQAIIVSCYDSCSILAGGNFSNYIVPIYQMLVTVIQDACQAIPAVLFYACLKAIPHFQKFIPSEDFFQLTGFVMNFLSSIDISSLSFKQINIINYVLKKFVSYQKENIYPFSSNIINFVFGIALQDIIPEIRPFDEDRNELQCYTIKLCPEDNQILCYSNDTINTIVEALYTVLDLFSEAQCMMLQFITPTMQIVTKWIANEFSFRLAFKSMEILNRIIECIKSQPNVNIDILSEIYHLSLHSISCFSLLNTEDDPLTINAVRNLQEIVEFVGEFISKTEIQIDIKFINALIFLTLNLYNKWIRKRIHDIIQKDVDTRHDSYQYDDIECDIGYTFHLVFQYFNHLISPEILSKLVTTFPLNLNGEFISPSFFGFWISFASFSPDCTTEQLNLIISFFQQCLNHPNLTTRRYAMENMLLLFNTGKFSSDIINSSLVSIKHLILIDRELYSRFIIPQLLLLIDNFLRSQSDISILVDLLLNCLPVSVLISRRYTSSSVNGLASIILSNYQILQNPQAVVLLSNLSFVFILLYKPPYKIKNQLSTFLKSVFFCQQGQLLLDLYKRLPISSTFLNDCLKYLRKLFVSIKKSQ
ncbi:hypothetical protein TRFO_08342 [Tritrichomonas foetus]|uniref:Importin N-terminal domain-containing protein n=1 Tax=Tritrichomonas foetus TaxID=1144522 RepID=A0A1J4JR08_9EUKA|nr:hypothetical protein TRFO_08342 [Tritrichomonas foetus]|eukprot:OHS99692.1 hypothetical protein TRFO_08342 [Tritrichomonas foetus]